ncbi:MAG TPA: alternative ribosome rescue aminoacyl-tRNA hydrolase ArfB [Solirubrobacteraceae bacterium]|jgi:ribosome-associated protein
MARDSGLRISSRLTIPMEEIELRTSRSSGPGGQHANVTASRVEAVFDVATSRALSDVQRARLLERVGPRVTAVAQDARSQLRNREQALERLRAKIEAALRVRTPRRPTAPTAASRVRRLDSKRANAERKRGRHPPALED